MSELHLICGLPGSGKSTLARRLEQECGAVRFTPDEWLLRLGAQGTDEEARTAVEAIQWKLGERLLHLGVNVVLEWGFWSRAERDELRMRAEQIGAVAHLHYLDAPREELIRRLALRNDDPSSQSFRVEISDLDRWIAAFEAPCREELGAS